MGKEQFQHHEQFKPQVLWAQIEAAWPGTRVINPKPEFPPETKAVFTLCPLYAPGSLSESGLLLRPQSIVESRVGQKWEALQAVIKAMHGYLNKVGAGLEATVVFANRGVLLNHPPGQEELSALSNHEDLYKAEAEGFFSGLGIKHAFYNYDDLGISFSRFVRPNGKIPIPAEEVPREVLNAKVEERIIWLLNHYFKTQEIPGEITNSKKNKKAMEQLIGSFGFVPTFWIVAGYLAFDHLLPDLLGDNGVYLSTERFGQLFRIARFTEGLKAKPRVEIPA